MKRVSTKGGILLASAAGLFAVQQAQAATSAAYRNAVLGDGATAYYEFDTATPTDSAGGDNNGTIQGTVTTGAASAFPTLGTAYDFGGAGAVRIPDAATFDLGTGPVTLELWYNSDVDARGDLFTYKGGGGDFGVHSNSQGDPAGFTGGVSVFFNGYLSDPGAGSTNNAWHHVAVTRDAAGAMNIYVDGTSRATGTKTDTLNIANDLLIGSNHNGDPGSLAIPFDGRIDEVAWYPVALTEAQIDNHIALAVPEPATLGALALGGILIGMRRRRA
jgi:hypothetical protein